jgi:RHS repeat-associated protein
MGACERFSDLSRTGNQAADRAERWRQIVNAYAECYSFIVQEVTDDPRRGDQRARELIRYTMHYGLTVRAEDLDRLVEQTVQQLTAINAKKENSSRDPTQKRVAKGADPVMMFNGQFLHDEEDMTIDGAGIDFAFHRTYRHQSAYDGPLGFGWDHNYNLRLRVAGDNVFRSTGALGTESFVRHPRFGDPGFSYWTPPDGTHAVLLEDGDSFVCRFPNGDRHVYDRDPEHPFLHRASRIEDKHGNRLLLFYSDGRLAQVQVNHHRRLVQFRYDDNDRIIAIEDYTGRRWTYDYDFFGDLVAVTTPQAPCGSTVRYEYSSALAPVGLQHNLVRIFDAEGRFYLENEYGQASQSLQFNRVIRQRLGSGDFWFEYEDFEEPLDFEYEAFERPAHVTTLTERHGQRIRHVYNTFGNLLRKEHCVATRSGVQHLVSRYRYNRDGALVASLTPEGVVAQSLFGRDAFVRRFDVRDAEDLRNHPALTVDVRQGFGRLLGSIERGSHMNTATLWFTHGEWGAFAPDILAPPSPDDIVRKLTYEPVYGQLRTVSDPRFTGNANPDHQAAPLEHPDYGTTLTRYEYRGPDVNPASDPFLLLDRIVRPRARNPDGTPAPDVVERFPEYDERGRLLTHVDPSGVRTEYTYFTDADTSTDGLPTVDGYLRKVVTDVAGLRYTYEYHTDGLGRATLERLPRSAEPDGDRFVVRKQYDEEGRLTRAIGPAPFRYEVRRSYDRTGMLVREERDALDETGLPIDGGLQVKTFEYDAELHPVLESTGGVDPSRRLVTHRCYDAAGRLVMTTLPDGTRTRIEYDARSLPIAQVRAAGTSDETTTRTEYDGDGRVVRTINGRGHITAFLRDAFGRIVSETDPLGHVTRRTYDKTGRVGVERVFERRANGSFALVVRTESAFDTLARRTRAGVNVFADPLPAADLGGDFVASPGPGRLLVTQNFYDANSRIVRVVDPLLRAIDYEYDALGRQTAEREPLGGVAINQYDLHGNLRRRDVVDRFVDPDTALPAQRALSWAYEYDTLDRRTAEVDGLGNITRFGYDSLGNHTSRIDPLGNRVLKSFDLHGRKIVETFEHTDSGIGGGARLPAAVSRYEYDDNGNLTAISDALGRRSRHTYDSLGRRRATIYPDGSRWSIDYDADSNPVRVEDANGVVRRLTVDPVGRLVRVSIDTSHAPGHELGGTREETYVYDALGRRTRTENDFVITETSVDSAGYAVRDALTVKGPGSTFTLQREFSDTGELVGLTYPGGRVVRLERDALERLVRIDNVANGLDFPGGAATPDAHLIATFVYAGKQPLQATHGNGAEIRHRHDAAGHVIEVLHTGQGAPLLRSQQLFDGAGNMRIRHEEDADGMRRESFQFDSERRLVRAEQSTGATFFDPALFAPPAAPQDPIPDGQQPLDAIIGPLAVTPGTETFVYDLAGNRRSENVAAVPVTYQVNDLDQYTARDDVTFLYDANGNLIGEGSRTYVYDHAGRLAGAREPGLDLRFGHDGLGRRVIEQRGAETTLFVYDRDNLIAEYGDGALIAQHVHADGLDRPVQTAVRLGADGAVFWLHADVTGSIRLLTGRTGALATAYRYAPFGETIATSGSGLDSRFRFVGRRLDAELGSYDFRARQYHPRLGRFMQRDPLGVTQDPNLYTYAGNNPLTFSDPLGTSRTDRQKRDATAAKTTTPPPATPSPPPQTNAPKAVDPPPAPPPAPAAAKPEWAKPELAEQYLKDYDQQLDAIRDKRNALWPRMFAADQRRAEAINMQTAARERLDEIRRNDIWPNWGSVNNGLTFLGTWAGCLTGSCIISLGVGALSLFDTDSGAVVGGITSCAPGPKSIGCGVALVTGSGSVLANRKDEEVKAVRRSAKDEANLMLEQGRKAQAAAEAELSNMKNEQDSLDDQELFLRKMHDYAKYGYPADNPMNQVYKRGLLL